VVCECDQVKTNNPDTCCEQVEEGRTAKRNEFTSRAVKPEHELGSSCGDVSFVRGRCRNGGRLCYHSFPLSLQVNVG
jgi:hypothetical protein